MHFFFLDAYNLQFLQSHSSQQLKALIKLINGSCDNLTLISLNVFYMDIFSFQLWPVI